jgi:hypothetical protein
VKKPKVGDLVKHWGKDIGIITHIFLSSFEEDGAITVLFEDGEYDVLFGDTEVIDEAVEYEVEMMALSMAGP